MATTCKAWTFSRNGSPRAVLSLQADRPMPAFPPPLPLPRDVPDPEEWVLVRVSHVGLNPAGLWYMSIVPAMVRAKVAVPELDLAGAVLDVWSPSSASSTSPLPSQNQQPKFAKGDAIMAFVPGKHAFPTGTGALASHVAIPARYALPRPPGVSARDAAGFFLATCTAWQLLHDARVRPGQRVLVNGASGGIGTMAVQLARHLVGSEGFVVGVCSGRNVDLVKSLGANEVIDYQQFSPVSAELTRRYGASAGTRFDAAVDAVGIQDVYARCAGYLAEEATYATVGIRPPGYSMGNFLRGFTQMQLNALWPRSRWLGGTGRRYVNTSMMEASHDLMLRLVQLLGDGTLRVVVDSEWDFEDILSAYDVLLTSHARGKVIVRVDAEDDS